MPVPKQEVIEVQAYFRRYHVTEIREQERQAGDCNDEDEVQDPVDEQDTLDDFLELEEEKAVGSGAPYAKARSVPLRERMMMMTKTSELETEIKVKGKFLMDGPWWIASFRAVEEGGVYICRGTPTYTLRNKEGQEGKSLLQLLLYYAFSFPEPKSAENQMKQAFWDYFEKWHSIKGHTDFTFCQFFKALEEALRDQTTPNNTAAIPIMQVAKVIMQRFDPSNRCFRHVPSHGDEEEKKPRFDLRYVYRCFKCPQLFKVLPLLMEREAFSILSTKKLRDLKRLKSVLKSSPADLGFYTSMRKHKWGTIEVSFQGFVNAGMIPPNLFKCTANQDSAPHLSSKSSSKQNCTLDQPSTSSANQDTVRPSTSKPKTKQNKKLKKVSIKMAKVLKLYDIVKSRCKEGKHTFLFQLDMEREWRKDACKNVPFGHIREKPFVELQERRVVKIEEKMFHWSKYRRYEESLARSMERLIDQHDAKPWTLPVEDFSEYNFDAYEQEAALHVCKNALTVILGRGGCGKTHVVASIIRKYLDYLEENRRLTKIKELTIGSEDTKESNDDGGDEENDEDWGKPAVLLTAPTGGAASILARRTGMEAKTLHSVLGTARRSNFEKFSKVEILVVDECSLVSISVLSELLRRLLDYSLKKVIFLGDPHYLPSIDPGNFLKDIIEVFQTTNPNFIQTLKFDHRTDEGGRLIVENARRIAEGKGSDLVYQPDRFEMIDTSDCEAGNDQMQMVRKLIGIKPQLHDKKQSQFVAFRNNDVKDINNVCSDYYAGHYTFKKGAQHNHHIGDKIWARKNSTIRILGRSNPEDKDMKKQEAEGSKVQREEEAEGSEVQREGEAEGSEVQREGEAEGSEVQREGEAEGSEVQREGEAEGSEVQREGEAEGSEVQSEGEAEGSEVQREGEAEGSEVRREGEAEGSEVQREGEAEGSEVDEDNQRLREGQAGPSKKKEEKGLELYRISNGDTFFIENMREVVENDGKKTEIATLQPIYAEEGTLFDVDFEEMRTRSKLEYAWARTIHTFQGSETDYIVYVISPNSYYETWQHLYTAITRGCKGCFIVGTPASLQEVVEKNPRKRQTSLARFLRENLRELLTSRSNPVDADLMTPDRPAPGNFSSSTSAKPNREKLSRKRKVKSNAAPVNQDVPCPQGGDRTSSVDSGVPKKKSCRSKLFP